MIFCLYITNRKSREKRNQGKAQQMAKLHFYYGVMASSKSAQLGINAFNFVRTENKWEAIKPATDNRDSATDIAPRHAH